MKNHCLESMIQSPMLMTQLVGIPLITLLAGCGTARQSERLTTPANVGGVVNEFANPSMYTCRDSDFEWSLRTLRVETQVDFARVPQSTRPVAGWSLNLRYEIADVLGQRSFRPVGKVVVTEALDSNGNDYHSQMQSYATRSGTDLQGTRRAFPVLWDWSGVGRFNGQSWPPRFSGTMSLQTKKLPRKLSIVRGYCDLEVATKSRFVDARVEELSDWKELIPGVRFRVQLAAKGSRSQDFIVDYEYDAGRFEAVGAVNALLVIDQNNRQTAVNFNRSEQQLDGVIRGAQATILQADSVPTLICFHVIEKIEKARLNFEVKDINVHETIIAAENQ